MDNTEQNIRFCTSPDGVSVAYATIGSGPPLVKAANWLNHLEFDFNSPVWQHWIRELSRNHTFVRYDQRGCGLSDWDVKDFSLDAWVSDLETVVDALGLERFPLIGISQGSCIAVAYTVRHPERVSHLILYGGYARGILHRGLSDQQIEERKAMIQLAKVGWGQEHSAFRQVFTSLFIPEGTPEEMNWFNELQRVSTSPEIAARLMQGFDNLNATDLATKVTVPTLVLHGKNDLRVPFTEGRLLASLIPDARFVPLDSRNHVLLENDPAWWRFLSEVRTFLGVETTAERTFVFGSSDARPAPQISGTRWQQINSLFNRAVNLPQGEREAFLNRACTGDTELRREFETLLEKDAQTGLTDRLEPALKGAIRSWGEESEISQGQTVSQYRVIEKLGEGGMGVIYKARDERLERLVALKFLPHYLSSDQEIKRRFLQEAKAAASLDHTNICTVYEIEEVANGQLFIVMPYYAGETLKEKIGRGPLPVSEAFDYALQTAEGLTHAHRAGIVHRDIKPANLFVTSEDRVKILDFGIAKVSDVSITRTGMVFGTLAYMSPEQTLGEAVDHRTDMWSLGVVLYEMLAGRRPFSRDSDHALFYAIQHESPAGLIDLRPDLPHELAIIVERLLEKDPARRYSSTDELIKALRIVDV